jgi:hypothetical protein
VGRADLEALRNNKLFTWAFNASCDYCPMTTSASGNSAPCHLHRTVAQFQPQNAAGPDLLAKISLVLAYQTVPHNQDCLRRSEQEFPDRVCSSWRFNRPEPAPPVNLVAGEMWVIDTLFTISLWGILNTSVESHIWPREHSDCNQNQHCTSNSCRPGHIQTTLTAIHTFPIFERYGSCRLKAALHSTPASKASWLDTLLPNCPI